MRRSTALRLIILALIAGVLTNFGICWYASWRGLEPARSNGMRRGYFRVTAANGQLWTLQSAWFSRTSRWFLGNWGGYGEAQAPVEVMPRGLRWPGSSGYIYFEGQFGWPLFAMWRYDSDAPLGRASVLELMLLGKPAFPSVPGLKSYGVLFPNSLRIPLRFIPSGFALNTVFWSSVWLALALGWWFLRRWRRVRRGLCTRCGYSRAGLGRSPCPECGAEALAAGAIG